MPKAILQEQEFSNKELTDLLTTKVSRTNYIANNLNPNYNSDEYSTIEGYNNGAQQYSHAEGQNTIASGNFSHSEGFNTQAAQDYQHVSGKYNVVDSGNNEENYVEIIGGGTSTIPKNIRTLDQLGNEYISGKLTLGAEGASNDNAITKKYIDDKAILKAIENDLPIADQSLPMVNNTPTIGTLTTYAKADHIHPIDTSRAPVNHATSTATYGLGDDREYGHVKLINTTSPSNNDGTDSGQALSIKSLYDFSINTLPNFANQSSIPVASSTAPKMNGTATTGTLTTYSRSNHVHPTDTGRVVKNHASVATTYGKGTDTNYGHIKLSDATNSTSTVSGGIAATPKAIQAVTTLLSQKADLSGLPAPASAVPLMDGTSSAGTSTTYARADHIHPSDTSRAPTSHASTTTTYGIGNASNYGHVMLSDATDDADHTATSGIAATPKAINTIATLLSNKANTSALPTAASTSPVIDGTAALGSKTTYARGDHRHPIDTSRAPKAHAVTATTYGAGSGSNYGHVKLSDTPNSSYGASNGIAATPKAIQSIQSSINSTNIINFPFLGIRTTTAQIDDPTTGWFFADGSLISDFSKIKTYRSYWQGATYLGLTLTVGDYTIQYFWSINHVMRAQRRRLQGSWTSTIVRSNNLRLKPSEYVEYY